MYADAALHLKQCHKNMKRWKSKVAVYRSMLKHNSFNFIEGLDPSGYKHTARYDEEDEALLNGTEISDEEKYRDCERFKFVCPNPLCGREIIVDAAFTGAGWLKCEDAACGTVTRRVPLTFQRGHPVCHACHRGLLHPLIATMRGIVCYLNFTVDQL
uniref:DNA polymerase alpha catalytic subunit n=1 Tax=Magallana gigas TaxID=29159 RepID=K1Q3A6_MAGGI